MPKKRKKTVKIRKNNALFIHYSMNGNWDILHHKHFRPHFVKLIKLIENNTGSDSRQFGYWSKRKQNKTISI